MGKYMRKGKISGEVAAMDVVPVTLGVRTRARTLALQRLQSMAASSSASYLQLRNRRLEKPAGALETYSKKNRVTMSPVSVSCLANSRPTKPHSISHSKKKRESEGVAKRGGAKGEGLAEIEAEASCGENVPENGRERNIRESTPCNSIRCADSLEAPGSATKTSYPAPSNTEIENVVHPDSPCAHEMNEFFAGAEQEQQKIFIEKYNYDPVKDLPLPGRYEWVRLDP